MSVLTHTSAFAPRASAKSIDLPRSIAAGSHLAMLRRAGAIALGIAATVAIFSAIIAIRMAIFFPHVMN